MAIGGLAKTSAGRQRVFLVDYQMPTDPFNIEVRKRIRDGALGTLQMVYSVGQSGGGSGFNDPPLGATIEDRLTGLTWVNDDAMGCGYIGNFDIHAIDAVIWALGRRPVAAYGRGGRCRSKSPHGDSLDTYAITYIFDDGLTWNHESALGPTHDWLKQGSLEASIQGDAAAARLSYWGKAYVRGGPKHYGGARRGRSLRRRRGAQHCRLLPMRRCRQLRQRSGPAQRRLHTHLYPRPRGGSPWKLAHHGRVGPGKQAAERQFDRAEGMN